jgi:hypothetical protein
MHCNLRAKPHFNTRHKFGLKEKDLRNEIDTACSHPTILGDEF